MVIDDNKRIIELLAALAHELRDCNEQEFAGAAESAASREERLNAYCNI